MKQQSTHSQEFIAEMREKLVTEESDLQDKLKALAHEDSGDYQSNFPDYGRHEEENASEIADFQATYSTTETIEARLKEVQAALKRTEDGSYGTTSDGETIPEDRLRANPAATTLINPHTQP